MERVKTLLKWNERSETAKTIFIITLVIGGTAGGYGLFVLAMGTPTPLVVVTSRSMVPTLNVGDLLVLKHVPEDDIKVGDIIVYEDSWYTAAPIVHRVIRIEEINGTKHFYTKGDNNSVEDPGDRVYSEITGVVVLTIPWVGNISLFLRGLISTPIGFITLIIIFGLIIFGPEIFCQKENGTEEETDEEQQEPSAVSDTTP
ncbi:MAG: signal peptidase I [Candidatus Thorarchaeota archaeon]|nr:signal peptidase I [Candidatus Thorarchaeota archaeon]